ncbi:hypothetical protein [Ascidiimonas aurantiaca]|uniref:hypothetical protein n=1 Tax=Ascidiimonas aurantiaca TaxID=1685432 RepID=UPI0030EF2A84
MNLKKTLALLCIAGLLTQCTNKPDPFLITENQIGKLPKGVLTQELDSIYSNDSLVTNAPKTQFSMSSKKHYEVYEKGGKLLLSLSPVKKDSVETIENIRVYDPRFITDKGISLNSTYGDIRNAYEVQKITSTLFNVVVNIKNSDVYFTIDKDDLPADLKYQTQPIEAVQIPDNTKIKYLMLSWSN